MAAGRWPRLDQLFNYLGVGFDLVLKLRGRPYASFARFCVFAGVGLLSVSIPTLLVQTVVERLGGGASNEAPWWVASVAGFLLILLGVGLFAYFYHRDLDRQQPSPLPTEGAVDIVLLPNTSFSVGTKVAGNAFGRTVTLQGFKQEELDAKLNDGPLSAPSLTAALLALRPRAADGNPIRAYSVKDEVAEVVVRVEEEQ